PTPSTTSAGSPSPPASSGTATTVSSGRALSSTPGPKKSPPASATPCATCRSAATTPRSDRRRRWGSSRAMTDAGAAFPEWILPEGTHVVTRDEVRDSKGGLLCPPGAAGKIVKAPVDGTHAYRVAFPDGREVSLYRQHLSIRKLVQQEDLDRSKPADLERDLWDRVIYRCVVGSRAYGLASEGSDVDRRGFYLPPADLHWSLFDIPEQLENKETEECYWEIRKFILMALKANPNVLECLYTPLVEVSTPLADELIAGRSV